MPRRADPRITWLVDFAFGELRLRPRRALDQLGADIAQFLTLTERIDRGAVIGVGPSEAGEPPRKTEPRAIQEAYVKRREAEIRTIRGAVRQWLDNFLDDAQRRAGVDAAAWAGQPARSFPLVSVSLSALSMPQLPQRDGGRWPPLVLGRWPQLVLTAATLREAVLGVAAILVTRERVPAVRRCAASDCKDKAAFPQRGKKQYCSAACKMRVLMKARRRAEASARTPRLRPKKMITSPAKRRS